MSKTSPSQINTRIARISKRAYEFFKRKAVENNSSIADELDKTLEDKS